MKLTYKYTRTKMACRALVNVSFQHSAEALPILLDTGSEVTILPQSWMKNLKHNANARTNTYTVKGLGDQVFKLLEHSETLTIRKEDFTPACTTTLLRIFFSEGLNRVNAGVFGMDYLTTLIDFHPGKTSFTLTLPDLTNVKTAIEYL